MKVKATAIGFHGGFRRRVGDVFDVADGAKSKWFVPVDEAKVDDKPKGRKKSPETFSEIAKVDTDALGKDLNG